VEFAEVIRDLRRQHEHDVEATDRRQIGLARGQPRGPCVPGDCEVLRPDGSRWTIFGTDITRQRYLRREAGRQLPLGLASVKSKAAAIARVERRARVKLTTDDNLHYQAPIDPNGEDLTYIHMVFGRDGLLHEIGVSLGET